MEEYKEPKYNHIDLKLTYACNFSCEYCYQRDASGTRQKGMLSEENIDNLFKFIDRLSIPFQVTLAGGEPFTYPYLDKLVEGLAKRNCLIMIITNFSAKNERIENLMRICGDKLKEFNISIHISQWNDINMFYDKLGEFIDTYKRNRFTTHIGTTCVVTKENFTEVQSLCKEMQTRFSEIPLKLHRVYYDGVYYKYSKEIEDFLSENHVDIPTKQVNNTYYGKICWTGCRFFYIESDGTVYRCYTRQEKSEDWILGTLLDVDNIRIFSEAKKCTTTDGGKCVCYEHFENVGFVTQSFK